MLLNLSNHPSAHWPPEQMEAALRQYGPVADLPFPAIDPHWDEAQVAALATEYVDKVLGQAPTAVHVMGELTFVFHFVANMRQWPGAPPCVASTSQRKVIEPQPGQKLVTFNFVRFRPY